MDGLDRLCSSGHGSFEPLRVEIEGLWLDVHEDGPGIQSRNHAGRGEEAEGTRDHLVLRADAERHQGDEKRVRAGGDADRVGRSHFVRESPLELLVDGSHDESAGREDLLHAPGDVALDIGVLAGQVEQGNGFARVHTARGILSGRAEGRGSGFRFQVQQG